MIHYKKDLISSPKIYLLIGKNIRRLRQQQNLTQENLAELIDGDQKYISKIESGKARPQLTVYLKIANAFHVSVDRFLIGAIEPLADLNKGSIIHEIFPNQAEEDLTKDLLTVIFRYLEEKSQQ